MRKPRRLVEVPHTFLDGVSTAEPRPDGYLGRWGWILRDLRSSKSHSYWVSQCVLVGCNATTVEPVCGPCGGWGPDAAIPVEWRTWFARRPTRARMIKMLETCFPDGGYEVI